MTHPPILSAMKKSAAVKSAIPLAEYADRRNRVLRTLKGAVGIVFAGEGGAPLVGRWRPDSNFLYLTGIDAEPGAAVVFDPQAEDPDRRCVLFLRPLDPEMERWDGYREEISSGLRHRTGFSKVMRAASLPPLLARAARRAKRLACLHPFAAHTANVSADLALFRKITERVPGTTIEDHTDLLPSLRAVKSRAEVSLMRQAALATALGYAAAARIIQPGTTENEIQHALETGYLTHGATGPAYNSIVGAGFNGTVLHYMANSGVAEDGDLVVIDSGASFGGYACDVTRTFPVGGRFSKEQRELYAIVLRAQAAAIKAAKPGARWHDVDHASRRVIDDAGLGDAYIHSVGHQLGMDVHDPNPDGPLKPGMVITIEPGIYLPDMRLGIRIEDDILVTASGNSNLTAAIPRKIEEVEDFMRS